MWLAAFWTGAERCRLLQYLDWGKEGGKVSKGTVSEHLASYLARPSCFPFIDHEGLTYPYTEQWKIWLKTNKTRKKAWVYYEATESQHTDGKHMHVSINKQYTCTTHINSNGCVIYILICHTPFTILRFVLKASRGLKHFSEVNVNYSSSIP